MNDDRPEGIIITISQGMLKEKGYKNWLSNFLYAMEQEDWSYWMRQGAKPRQAIASVYLCIGNKIRYRANYVMAEGPCYRNFNDGIQIWAKAWIVLAGPVTKPLRPIPFKGFRGFRYTQKLF